MAEVSPVVQSSPIISNVIIKGNLENMVQGLCLKDIAILLLPIR